MREDSEKRKWMPNSGFSLIELVVIIAIVAALTAILAPQYLKYVNKAKVAVDVDNATEIVKAVEAEIADGSIPLAGIGSTREITATDISNITAFPKSKVDPDYVWKVTVDDAGIRQVTLGTYEIWPDPDGADGYRTAH